MDTTDPTEKEKEQGVELAPLICGRCGGEEFRLEVGIDVDLLVTICTKCGRRDSYGLKRRKER